MENMKVTKDGVDYHWLLSFDAEEYGQFAAMINDENEVILIKYHQDAANQITMTILEGEELENAAEVFEQVWEAEKDDDSPVIHWA